MAKKRWIPKISDEELNDLFTHIKPVIDFYGKGKRYIEPVDLRGTAFIWDPEPAEKAKGLKMLRDIRTYHSYAYYGLFKPSIAEVIAQIPKELLDQVIAFEIIKKPETADDMNGELEALNAGYHVATTRLYTKETIK